MPSTIFNASTASVGGPVVYAASSSGASWSSTSPVDTSASISLTTTATNTKWLIEVEGDVYWSSGSGPSPSFVLAAKVDGSYAYASGGSSVAQLSQAGYRVTEITVRGRVVVTLASASSHTILAALIPGSSDAGTLRNVSISATQLTG